MKDQKKESNQNSEIKLTAKQQRFVEEYLVDKNATQAALRSGYSEKTAFIIGHENLKKPKIAEAIQEKLAKLTEKAEIEVIDVLKGFKRIAMFDPRKLFDENGKLKSISDLDDDTALAIAGIDISENTHLGDEEIVETITKKIKQSDRIKAWENLGKYLKMFDTGPNVEVNIYNNISEKAEKAAELLEDDSNE